MKIKEIEISDDIINNALIGAREGATNYWAQSRLIKELNWDNFMPSQGRALIIGGKQAGQELWVNKEYKAAQSFFDQEEPTRELFVTHEAIKRGLKLMAEKYPKHFADLIGERDDSCTHDIFLQCCLLNDVIYG